MNGTSTSIAYDCRVASIVWVNFAFFAVLSLLFPLTTQFGLVLDTVLAHILEPRTISSFFVFGRAFHILEAIDFLDGFEDRSASREDQVRIMIYYITSRPRAAPSCDLCPRCRDIARSRP
jgi:hypothetical protein